MTWKTNLRRRKRFDHFAPYYPLRTSVIIRIKPDSEIFFLIFFSGVIRLEVRYAPRSLSGLSRIGEKIKKNIFPA